jgi:hypothetical protein
VPLGDALLWYITLHAALQPNASTHPQKVLNYSRVPFCALRGAASAEPPPNPPLRPHRLAACMSVTLQFLHLMPEWIAYHATMQGYEHFYVYLNDVAAPARALLRAFVDAGLVTLVDFEWEPALRGHLVYQQAAENACLLRARGAADWVALHDVDEFLTGPRLNASSRFVDALPPGSSVDTEHADASPQAFRLLIQWYGHNVDAARQKELDSAWPTLVLGRMRTPGDVITGTRQKCVVRPRAVRYFSVHGIVSGASMRDIAPDDARFMHFKQASYMALLAGAPDDALLPAAAAIRDRLESLAACGYPELLIRPPPPPASQNV